MGCSNTILVFVSYGLIGWVGVGINYIKPFVCICKHTATDMCIYGGAAQLEVGYLTVRISWPSALHCNPCPTPCSPGNALLLSIIIILYKVADQF